MMLRVQFAEGCAWRGAYLYRPIDVETGWNCHSDQQVARIVFDPSPISGGKRAPFWYHRAAITISWGGGGDKITIPLWRSRNWWKLDGRHAYNAKQRDLRNQVSA